MRRVVPCIVLIFLSMIATSCISSEKNNPVYSSGYMNFRNTQDQYERNKSTFSPKARELYEAISPGMAEIDYSKPMDRKDVYLACFGLDKASMEGEYFSDLYKKDVADLTPQEVRAVTLFVRYSNTKLRLKDPFFAELALYYGFDSPEDFYRFGEYLASYVPYPDEKEERIDFSPDELYQMYREGTMVFPRTDAPVEDIVRNEMRNMPEVLRSKSFGFTFREAVENQAWMRKENSLVRSLVPQARRALDENGLEISFDSLESRIMAQYCAERL